MTKFKFLSVLSAGLIAASSTVAVAAAVGTPAFHVDATDCTHSHVEHYITPAAVANNPSIVEHWACCTCHQAWADEALTQLISSDTSTDRSKLDVDLGLSFDTNWSPVNTTLVYNEENGYAFKARLTELGDGARNAIETTGVPTQLSDTESFGYFGRITNKSSTTIRVDIHTRDWGARSSSFELAVGETKDFSVTIPTFNSAITNGNYGFAILCYNQGAQSEGGYVEISAPSYQHEAASFLARMENQGWQTMKTQYSAGYGYELVDPGAYTGSTYRFIRKAKIDTDHYSGVSFKVYNNSSIDTPNGSIWNEAWGDSQPAKTGILKAHEWTDVTIPASVWNYDNDMMSIYDLGTVDGGLKFADFHLVPNPTSIVAFGQAPEEKITHGYPGPEGQVWPEASKVVTEKGDGFSMDLGAGCLGLATNNKKPIDASAYTEVFFWVYNGTDADFSMYSTSDWTINTNYGTIAQNTWVKCVMPVSEYNKGTTYLYPSAGVGTVLMTYWYAM